MIDIFQNLSILKQIISDVNDREKKILSIHRSLFWVPLVALGLLVSVISCSEYLSETLVRTTVFILLVLFPISVMIIGVNAYYWNGTIKVLLVKYNAKSRYHHVEIKGPRWKYLFDQWKGMRIIVHMKILAYWILLSMLAILFFVFVLDLGIDIVAVVFLLITCLVIYLGTARMVTKTMIISEMKKNDTSLNSKIIFV